MVDLKLTSLTFDVGKVRAGMEAASKRALQKAGMLVRRVARQELRRSKKPSSPGQPPTTHGKGQLRNFLLSAWDSGTKSVVVGPKALGRAVVPNLLEKGGQETVIRRGKTREVTIDSRAFMGPALASSEDLIEDCWTNSIR